MKTLRATWLCVGMLLEPTFAQERETPRPRIGLVLSGGGARGAAHVGVLKVLEQLRVPVDAIAGTSMGSIVGGLYACGWSPDELDELFTSLDWRVVLDDYPPRSEVSFRRKRDDAGFLIPFRFGWDFENFTLRLPSGLIEGHNVLTLLEAMTAHIHAVEDFDHLPIPFRCVAADLGDGSKRVFDSGSLATAIRASMSLPAIFDPIAIGGRRYVDGGIVDNLPIDVVRELDVDVVIAVDVGEQLADPEQVGSLFGVSNQVIGLMMKQNIAEQQATLTDTDVFIPLPLEGISSLDFPRCAEAIAEGVETAGALQDRLAALAVGEVEWREFLRRQRLPRRAPRIAEIRIDNESSMTDELILAVITQEDGEELDVERLRRDMMRLGGYQVLQDLTFRIEDHEMPAASTEEVPPADLVIHAADRELGPHYFQFGLQLANDFQGQSEFNAAMRHTWMPANSFGGEWRNEIEVGSRNRLFSEYYQPLDRYQRWFVVPQVQYLTETVPLVLNGVPLASADTKTLYGTIAAGRVIDDVAEIRFGYTRLEAVSEVNVGLVGAGQTINQTVDDGYVFSRLTLDSLDSLNFPQTGWFGEAEWRFGTPGLGGDADYSALRAQLKKPLTIGDTTVLPNAEFGYSWEPTQVFSNQFRLGGFTRLSGLEPNELIGDSYALGSLIVYHQLSKPATKFSSAFYMGGSIEYGEMWARDESVQLSDMRFAGSLFGAADTLLGPAYVGIGLSEGGRRAAYLYLGQQF